MAAREPRVASPANEHARRRAGGARAPRAQPARADAARRRRRRRRRRVERHQHRHRAAALVRPHAALPRHGLPAGPRLRVGRPRRRRRRRAPAAASASACSCPAPAASARCAACSAAPPPGSSCPARASCRSTSDWASEAVLLALAATAQHAIAGGAAPPDLIVGHGVLGRLLARLAVAGGRRARSSGSATRTARDGADGLPRARPRRGPAPRLPRDLRRQRRRRRCSTR